MKIISKFKDYYDGVSRTDREDKPLYLRHTRFCAWPEDKPCLKEVIKILNAMPHSIESCFDRHVIVFCGTAFPVYVTFSNYGSEVEPCYDLESMIAFFENKVIDEGVYSPRCYKNYIAELKKETVQRSTFFNRVKLNSRSWKDFQNKFDNGELSRTISDDLFIAMKSPVAIVSYSINRDSGYIPFKNPVKITINPVLSKLDFAKHVDPYQAYQKIDTFSGNNLANIEPLGEPVSDELKIHYKGFDKKYGFRTRPNKSKT